VTRELIPILVKRKVNSPSKSARAGSILGDKKAMNRLR
jgi:hypothetical protein